MKTLIILSFILFCVACSTQPLTEEQLYERENKEILRLEKFYADEAVCESKGGHMYIKRHMSVGKLRRNVPPRWGEQYSCMDDWALQRLLRQLQGGHQYPRGLY